MRLESSEFNDNGEIPVRYGYTKKNINPPLEVKDVPDEASSLVLVMDDPDAVEPAGKIWDHWLVWNLPPRDQTISEGAKPAMEGENDYGEVGYGGPNPPDGEHKYFFRLYALDIELGLEPGASRDELESHMKPHIVEQAELTGRYSPV